jgi:hypothetical protein
VLDVCALRFHSGTASRRTSSRIKWLRERRITTWTRLPRSCSRSAVKLPGNHGVVSPVTSIRKSTSLSGVSSPRATEPNNRTFPAPWRAASLRISSRCSLIWRPALTTPFYRSAVCAPVSIRIPTRSPSPRPSRCSGRGQERHHRAVSDGGGGAHGPGRLDRANHRLADFPRCRFDFPHAANRGAAMDGGIRRGRFRRHWTVLRHLAGQSGRAAGPGGCAEVRIICGAANPGCSRLSAGPLRLAIRRFLPQETFPPGIVPRSCERALPPIKPRPV